MEGIVLLNFQLLNIWIRWVKEISREFIIYLEKSTNSSFRTLVRVSLVLGNASVDADA